MKQFIRTAIAIAMLFIYAACQKEVSDIIPVDGPTPTDSSGTDSAVTPIPDSLTIISFSPDSGRIGTQIQVTGTGFDTMANGSLVLINKTAAKIISATKTVLTVQVQEGTTTGKISVAANGKTATSLTNFVVLKDSVVTDTTATKTNVWTRKADPLAGSYTFVQGFSIGNKGYFFTSYGLRQYDPATNTWSQKKKLPSDVGHNFGFCFVIGGKAYIGLGAGDGGENISKENFLQRNYNEVWAYDAVKDSWTRKADFPGKSRVIPFSFSVNGMGYMGGGDTANYNIDHAHDFWKYNPTTDAWTRLADFPGTASMGFSGFSLAGAGYVLEAGPGNPTAPTGATYSDRLWKYNISSNTWEQKAKLPVRSFISGVAFTIKDKAYAALGGVYYDPENPAVDKNNFWQYDPASNTWAQKADACDGRQRWLGTGFAVGGKGYVGLGTGDTFDDYKNDFWEYTPE